MQKHTPIVCRRLWGIAVLLIVLLLATSCDTLIKPVFPPTPSETVGADSPTGSADLPDEPSRDTAEPSPDETLPDETGAGDTEHTGTESDTLSDTACNHVPTVIPAVEPTCSERGMTEGSECALCGDTLRSPIEIPPLGHSDSPELGYRCTSCDRQAICPAPVLSREGGMTLSWGEPLSLSWTLAEDTPYPVVYQIMSARTEGESIALWETWKQDTAFTYNGLPDGETLILRVYACLAINGEPVVSTQSQSAALTVTVTPREELEAPAFLTGNRVTVQIGKEATVAWGPVTADGGQIAYRLTLVDPDGEEIPLETQAETWVTIPASFLTKEGCYTLLVTAIDVTDTYRNSPTAELTVYVRAPAPTLEEDFDNPARYASEYYYNYLATLSNGEKLQSFYRLLDASLTEFHSAGLAQSIQVSGGNYHYYAAKLNFASLGLTRDEAASVRSLYQYDHPLYYWISNVYVYTSKDLYVCVDPDYVTADSRKARNAMIYEGIADMADGLITEASSYNLALAYYERLLGCADYAYEEDGETPQDDLWAHSIVGVFDPDKRAVVCEGFAKAYSLLLNYHGVENISVPGMSRGVGHLWNLLRMDNGQWYWCDITWDDTTHSPLGTDYKYFCVTDTQDVLFYYVRDGIEAGKDYTFSGSSTFMDDHTVQWDGISLDMSHAIPARAETPYGGDVLTLRETFTVDGMTYALTGFGKVQLVAVESGRSLTVSETVTYRDVTYTVTSIGLINSEGVFMTGRLLPLFTTSVYVPKTVSYIWDGALSGLLVNVTVDPENPWYVSQNGSVKPRTP
jgi:hypothetical protein